MDSKNEAQAVSDEDFIRREMEAVIDIEGYDVGDAPALDAMWEEIVIKTAQRLLSAQPAVQVPQDTKTGVDLIAAERARQIAVEGWTPEHDDEHDGGELAMAAALYAAPEPLFTITKHYRSIEWNDPWPWHDKVALCRGGFAEVPAQDKRKTHCRLRALEIAGALIAAEIDRLQRAATPSEGAGE